MILGLHVTLLRIARVGLLGIVASACAAKRTLLVDSVPPGAEVEIDGQRLGRTPLELEFQHYGARQVQLTLPGFAGWTKVVRVKSPWYGRFPFDFLSEILFPIGWRDHHEVLAVLEPQVGTVGDPDLQAVLGRARALRAIMDEARRRRMAEGEQAAATALEPLLPSSEQGDAAADPNSPAQGEDDGG